MGRIAADAQLDGKKGIETKSNNTDGEDNENNRNLHKIERAFRKNKTDHADSPIYHMQFKRREENERIRLTAYTIQIEIESTVQRRESKKDKKNEITIYRAKFLAESLYEIEYVNPYNGKKMSVMLRTDHDDEVIRLLEAVGHVT